MLSSSLTFDLFVVYSIKSTKVHWPKSQVQLPLNSRTTGCAWSQVSWLYNRLFTWSTCCCVMEWIFWGMHTLTGEVIALVADVGFPPFLEGVVVVSLLPLLPTLPILPEGDGGGDRGDGVPVILWRKNRGETLPFFFL